ncbi:MAG: ADP-ribosylglycohydrolase family protein [Sphaerochaeta sp.]|nr:ADP-ribosylglycohydrolase family protein [Sphaerochaeta sp.]
MDEQDRASGCLLGVFIGDAFGSQAEGEKERDLLEQFPEGIVEMYSKERTLGDCGEITEESELTILLAQSLIFNQRFTPDHIKASYRKWVKEEPVVTKTSLLPALEGAPMAKSESNGALIRIAPLGIYGANKSEKEIMKFSESECELTHLSQVAKDASKLLALSVAKAVREPVDGEELARYMITSAGRYGFDPKIIAALQAGKKRSPQICDGDDQESVLIALQLVLHTLLNTSTLQEGMETIVMKGGSAGSNTAIFGMLGGAVYGKEAVPERWLDELQPSPTLVNRMKKETTQRRQHIQLDKMADELSKGLLLIQ